MPKLQTLPPQISQQLDELCALSPVIPVLTFNTLEEALPIAEALVEGGLTVLEVTLRTPVGLEAIQLLSDKLPEAHIGAGTVLNPEQYKTACDAGSQFIVTPGATDQLLQFGVQSSTPLLPGVQTLSELMTAYAYGYRRFKFFPAEVAGGTAALKAYAGPLTDIRFCPTGGIRLETAADYLILSNVMCVGGSWLTPADRVADKDWAAIRQLARDTLFKLRSYQLA